ncbi:hypothetical protein EMO92_10005 [Bifidobacterium reuteri]|uniref:Uncharacterized protein n=1 Tax=Bifidobacterium reuteri TaxID=983706 RepID=A0A5J5E2H5_9BIFI|nr:MULTISPECIES: hypothetical protein [Bifidobacterium]KAA8818539.1 hypothetical protein CSQ85_08575 [Bifidobacterium rousetti]KAA8823350.1 hypothetical protein EMO92_10005 [Bifidobacterium reuteri]
MIKTLFYKDATARPLQVVCLAAVCWVIVVYAVALMPISMDESGNNPLNNASSMTLASQATVIIAIGLANIEIRSGETMMAALITGSRCRMAYDLMVGKAAIIVIAGLFLTVLNTVGNGIIYGIGDTGRFAFQYLLLAVMNGIAVLSLSLFARSVLLGLSIYVFVPMLLKPFIIYLIPATNELFYPEAIREATADCSLVGTLMSIMWLLVFIIAGYAAMGLRLHRAIDIG